MKQTILLLEDDESLNRGISLKLQKENYFVLSATTIQEGLTLFSEHEVDFIICDVGLPDGSGLDFCRTIRKTSSVLFLFLTALDTEIDFLNGYDAGADDYLTKPFSLMVLLSKVSAMLRRTAATTETLIVSGNLTLHLTEKRVLLENKPLSLTPNEHKLLTYFMQNPQHILSKGQILSALWDNTADYADENTVAVNIRRLREKIEPNPSSPHYIKNVRGLGYIWEMECLKQ